jgi:transposase
MVKVIKVAEKPLKTAVRASNPHITELVCSECGQRIGVVDGSKCWHCGCVMDKVIKRRKK